MSVLTVAIYIGVICMLLLAALSLISLTGVFLMTFKVTFDAGVAIMNFVGPIWKFLRA